MALVPDPNTDDVHMKNSFFGGNKRIPYAWKILWSQKYTYTKFLSKKTKNEKSKIKNVSDEDVSGYSSEEKTSNANRFFKLHNMCGIIMTWSIKSKSMMKERNINYHKNWLYTVNIN